MIPHILCILCILQLIFIILQDFRFYRYCYAVKDLNPGILLQNLRRSCFTLKTKQGIRIIDKLFAHLETWRLYTVIWCGLVSLAGSCIAYESFPGLKTALMAFFIPMMGWSAGLYLSDFLDRKLDAIQKPHRPIPSGRIKPKEALVIGALFAVTGFILSFLLSTNDVILVFVVAGLVFTYARLS